MTVMETPVTDEAPVDMTETEQQLVEILEIVQQDDGRTAQQLRILEAILFAASAPLDEKTIVLHMARGPVGEGADVPALIALLKEQFASRGVEIVEISGRWSLRTAADLADYLKTETSKPVKLSRAMSEVLAIIAYHQPVTRAEVETIRGVATSKGTLDYLMALGWIRPGSRRESPGRPLTWVTTPAFLNHFGLGSTHDLPGMEELRAAGLLDAQAVSTYGVIAPSEEAELPPAIEGLVESEPEFLPSEETVAEAAEGAVEAEEVAAETEEVQESDEELAEDLSDDDDDFDDDDDDFVDEDDDAEYAEADDDAAEEEVTSEEALVDEVEPSDVGAEIDELEEEPA